MFRKAAGHRLIIVKTYTPADDRLSLGKRLIREAASRTEVVPIRWIDRIESVALEHDTPGRKEDAQVLGAVVDWPFIVEPNPIVEGESLRDTPRVLSEEVEGVDEDLAFRFPGRDIRGIDVTGKKICERLHVVVGDRGVGAPGTGTTGKTK